MNAFNIKDALSYVHFWEKTEGRLEATKIAIKNFRLDESEREILMNALNISKDEITFK